MSISLRHTLLSACALAMLSPILSAIPGPGIGRLVGIKIVKPGNEFSSGDVQVNNPADSKGVVHVTPKDAGSDAADSTVKVRDGCLDVTVSGVEAGDEVIVQNGSHGTNLQTNGGDVRIQSGSSGSIVNGNAGPVKVHYMGSAAPFQLRPGGTMSWPAGE